MASASAFTLQIPAAVPHCQYQLIARLGRVQCMHSLVRNPWITGSKPADLGLSARCIFSSTEGGFSGARRGFKGTTQVVSFKGNNGGRGIQMTLVDERPLTARTISKPPARVLDYELVQGALVRWSELRDRSVREPPTAVLLHGILGARRNWASFARRLAEEFPSWQFLLVDLRCHGDSASIPKKGPHTVASAARDVLNLIGQLKLTPRILVGHSFGGKVALSMVDQAAKPLARPVQVWVLDATPGTVRAGRDGEDHPAELISALQKLPKQVPSRRFVVNALSHQGFSGGIAQWMTTNLRPNDNTNGLPTSFSWVFDLDGISDMYISYENTNLWRVVENIPQGVHVNFLRAERSLHRWAHEDVKRIHMAESLASGEGAGVQMHVLEDAGHWVHTDNPDGLFKILASSFKGYEL